MKFKDFFISVPVVSKKNEDKGMYKINLANVMYYRRWPLRDSDKEITGIYMVGGKEIRVNLPIEALDELDINEEK